MHPQNFFLRCCIAPVLCGLGFCLLASGRAAAATNPACPSCVLDYPYSSTNARSEEHTSELQSQSNLVCRLLLEKKKRYRSEISNATKLYRIKSGHLT